MGLFAQKARLSFLDHAAHSYAVSAPSTSAHLMMQYRAVAAEMGSDGTLLPPKGTCGACGGIMIPGQTCRTLLDDPRLSHEGPSRRKRRRHNPSKPPPSNPEKTMHRECLLCRRATRKPLPRSKSSKVAKAEAWIQLPEPSRSLSSIPSGHSIPGTPNNDSPKSIPANANSRKRAKARKESGLGALLAKAKSSQAPSPGFGLDLLDMMKEV
ncbi:RNAse P, Rpr2/Rpp21 subunit [Lasallia pustulata]|uniref:RNAse P, Rpr2/Rpp21 subunit n=1 Tax=Lasallia pustulata TaxID=136370 RepID=A0A1W5D033_9LECA|nr:RNAse P, Rpr2/Rpp21 subunit [Lasallia pustulata]